jgi:hypothetical protein
MECVVARMHYAKMQRSSNLSPTSVSALETVLSEVKNLYTQLSEDPSVLSSCLRAIHDEVCTQAIRFVVHKDAEYVKSLDYSKNTHFSNLHIM